MLICWQPSLGNGCSHEIPSGKVDACNDPMHLNLMGHPEDSWFLAFAALKETYSEDDEVLPKALELLALDLPDALVKGILVRGGHTLRLALISCKGDWPWLIEAGGLTRHFRHAPKLGLKFSVNCKCKVSAGF